MKDRVKKKDGVPDCEDRPEPCAEGTAASHYAARRLQIKRFAGLDGRPAARLTVAGGIGDNLLSWLGIMVE